MGRTRLQRAAWIALVASCTAYVLVSIVHGQPFYPWGRLGSFDLRVYRGAGSLVLDGRPVYDGRIYQWAPFTYPPIAAVLMTPLALLPLSVDQWCIAIMSGVALLASLARALRLRAGGGPTTAPSSRSLLPAAAAAALWLEPVTATLGYGQIDLFITLLIVCDLSRSDEAGSKGALIGLAAGLKLTPLIFLPYLLLSGRRRAAAVALGSFAATVAAGFAFVPADSTRFWGGLFLDPGRTGGCCIPPNQSLRGAILGLAPSLGGAPVLALSGLVGGVGVLLAARAARRGDEAVGFCVCAIAGLLASPVSWTHHWALAVPAVLLIGVRVCLSRSKAGVIAACIVLVTGYSYLPKLMAKPGVAGGHGLASDLASSPYVLIGVFALGVAFLAEARRARSALGVKHLKSSAALCPLIDLKGTHDIFGSSLTPSSHAGRSHFDATAGSTVAQRSGHLPHEHAPLGLAAGGAVSPRGLEGPPTGRK